MDTTDKQDFQNESFSEYREDLPSRKMSARAATPRNFIKISTIWTPKYTIYIKDMLKRSRTKEYDPKIAFFGFLHKLDRANICKKTPKMKTSCIFTHFYLKDRENSMKSRKGRYKFGLFTYK